MAQMHHQSSDYASSSRHHAQASPPAHPPMAFPEQAQFMFAPQPASEPLAHRPSSPSFDIFDWHPKYASCQQYFLNHAQHSGPVQAVAVFLNILLPYQRHPPVHSTSPTAASSRQGGPTASTGQQPPPFQPFPSLSLTPYLRRLVVTGLDYPGVLHGFFGDDWALGIGPQHEQERRNFLFAAKSGGWRFVKRDYDMGPMETVPFLRPLQNVAGTEIEGAEMAWSKWLLMEDWMVGPRAPTEDREGSVASQHGGQHGGQDGRYNAGQGGSGSGSGSGSGGGGRRAAMHDYDNARAQQL